MSDYLTVFIMFLAGFGIGFTVRETVTGVHDGVTYSSNVECVTVTSSNCKSELSRVFVVTEE